MKYTLKNTYHNSQTATKYSPEERAEISMSDSGDPKASAGRQAMRRARKALCGMSQCSCCNSWGER